MTIEDTQKSIWNFMTSVPAKIVTVIAALVTLVGFGIAGGRLLIEGHALTKRGMTAMDKVDRVEGELQGLKMTVEDIKKSIDGLKGQARANATSPIRFADIGSRVTSAPPGGIGIVTWQIYVARTDCPPPELALNLVDAEDIVRPVAIGDFRPVKLEARSTPTPISYEIIAPEKAAPGLGLLWAEATYRCPNDFQITIPSPKIRWRILKEHGDKPDD